MSQDTDKREPGDSKSESEEKTPDSMKRAE